MASQTSKIWLSYDLGVRGDYEGMYSWLDAHKAEECGDSLAVFDYDYSPLMVTQIKREITESVKTDKRTRIYLIYRDRESGQNKGRFLLGGRRAAAWTGYAPAKSDSIDVEV